MSTERTCKASAACIAIVMLASPAIAQPATVSATAPPPNRVPVSSSPVPLSRNDVSILFPVPTSRSDLPGLIRMSDLVSRSGAGEPRAVWSTEAFEAFRNISHGEAGLITTGSGARRIRLPASGQSPENWFVAGIRLDHAAPGGSPEIIAQLGQQPQIRLIVQPVSFAASGKAQVEDVAAHLIFSFAKPQPLPPASAGCLPRPEPDQVAFNAAIGQFLSLRDRLASGAFEGGKILTAGKPLGVHPGLSGASRVPFTQAIKATLQTLLVPERLQAFAVMGLANGGPEPWIFLSMVKLRAGTPLPGGGTLPADAFVPAPNPVLDGKDKAQMLSFVDSPKVQPKPIANNLTPTTCHHATFQAFPMEGRKGSSTADIIDGNLSAAEIRKISNLIADPVRSHFFNTDCVSCHTETQLFFKKANGPAAIPVRPVTGIATSALPSHNWNVRNFGWFPNFFDRTVRATVTRRTANETAEVVAGVNAIIVRDGITASPAPATATSMR